MKHATEQEWQEYVTRELESHRYEAFEEHLYHCESCLELYIQAVDLNALISDTKSMSSELEAGAQSDFADQVMLVIHGATHAATVSNDASPPDTWPSIVESPVRPVRRIPLMLRPLFQYSIAAAVTIMLISTGVFQNIGHLVERDHRINSPISQQEKVDESFSQRLMEKTTSLLGSIHSNRTGGSLRE